MASAFRAWLLNRRRRNQNGTCSSDGPELPFLQNQPRRPLSLHSSRDPLTGASQSKFFLHLPPELRRQILVATFGRLPIHIDLRLDHPPLGAETCRSKASDPPGHGGYLAPLASSSIRDLLAPLVWQWWSCVCHRNLPYPSRSYIRLCDDGCLGNNRNALCLCDEWPGSVPGKCMIGVVGWLQSCRQAYIEGIDVLYSTNTFIIESQSLLDTLLKQHDNPERCLLRPESLGMIHSLEMKWNFVIFASDTDAQERDRTTFETYMRFLPLCFPHLTHLYITFGEELYGRVKNPSKYVNEIDSVFLNTIAGTMRRSKLQKCKIEVPSNLIMALRHRAITAGTKVIHSLAITEIKVWYAVSEQQGYWITWGEEVTSTRPSVLF